MKTSHLADKLYQLRAQKEFSRKNLLLQLALMLQCIVESRKVQESPKPNNWKS